MSDQKVIDLYARLLNDHFEEKIPSDPLLIKTIQKGILVSLGEDGSPEAIKLLSGFIPQQQDLPLVLLGLKILDHLAANGNNSSKNALCRLFIQHNLQAARQLALERQLIPDDPSEKVLFLFLTGQFDKYDLADPDYALLTSTYLASDSDLKKRLVLSAKEAGLDELVLVLNALQHPNEGTLASIVNGFLHFKSQKIKDLVVFSLSNLAEEGSQLGQDALCQLFIATENQQSLAIVKARGYLPSILSQRALFYLLSDQISKYEELDFNRSLLASIYGSIEKSIRNRIITQVQRNGHPDWIKGITGNSRIRFVNDLTDADWGSAISSLKEKGDWTNLWKLAQVSPPFWSASILMWLREVQPVSLTEDLDGFSRLVDRARTCIDNPPAIDHIKRLTGHLLEVTCLASDALKSILISGSADQSIRVWDFESGELQNLVSYPGRQIRSLAVSPDGKLVAVSTDDHNIQVINLSDNRFIKSFQGHTSTVKSIAITPDGWFLVSGSFDRSIKLWRFPFGPELKTISGSISEVFCLTLSADRRYIFSGGADRVVRIWSLPDGSAFKVLEGHTDTVTSVAASQDGQYLASSSRDNTIRIWDLPSGNVHKDLLLQNSLVTCLVFNPDSQILLSGHLDGSVNIWNISTGIKILSIPAHQGAVTGLVLNLDGTVLASSSNDRKINLWDISAIVLTRVPIDRYTDQSIHQIREKSNDKRVSASNRNWLQFSLELYQFKRRFDIEIGEPKVIQTGNFDIEL